MNIERLTAEHLHAIDLHEDQREARRFWSPQYEALLLANDSYAAVARGRVLICGGVLSIYDDSRAGHVWSLMARDVGHEFLAIHRLTRRFFETCGRRVLVATTVSSSAGCRWLGSLGFKFDHVEPKFDPLGRAHDVYVRAL